MTKLTLKVLLGIGGASVACATSLGIFYGLKNNSGVIVQSDSSISPSTVGTTKTAEEALHSFKQQITKCKNEDDLEMEIPSNGDISPEDISKLKVSIAQDGKCDLDVEGEEGDDEYLEEEQQK